MSEEPEAPTEEATEATAPPPPPEHQESAGEAAPGSAEINLESLLDVPVTLSVEIGRSKVPIRELVSLNQGSVIELDRTVDEPLDLLVNGKLMARGEVVVVDGQFGLRLIEVVSPSERLKKLK
ncbi:MAG: flagellar motor switch protein FliN [Halioglobus sp.]